MLFFLWLDDIIFLFGKGYQSRLYSLDVGAVRSGCCSVLEKMMGRRGSSMRYSYVCVLVLAYFLRVMNLGIVIKACLRQGSCW